MRTMKRVSQTVVRHFSATRVCAVSWPKPDYGPMEVQRSTLLNGINVAAARSSGAQIGACTIMYQAGSRYEWDGQLGASHFIRATSTATGCAYTAFAKTRYLQQHGASLTCSSDRQTVAFTLRCPLVCFSDLKYYLLDVATRCCYLPWEIDARKTLVRGDLTRMDPEQRVMDLIQRACWAGPLGNSVFCEDERIGAMSPDNLKSFVDCNFTTDVCTVASFGMPFEETIKLAEKIEFGRSQPDKRCEMVSFPRNGFELYDMGRNSDTWIAIAVPGCGTYDLSCLLKHAIVAEACGTANMQDGMHDLDRTPQPPLGLVAGDDVYTQYRMFNISYRETGVFGILVKTRACSAWDTTLAAAEFLANVGDISFKQIEVGKNRLKLGLALHDEDCVKVTEGLALQIANDVQIDSHRTSIPVVDALCAHEIRTTAKAISDRRSQISVAVVGDIGAVPHDKEIIFNACLQ
ncbi:cytochrome b-c1 complex subunit 2, mitochondrial isoform X1 [Manduca sexta]|uniref:cytochrome b-c1 complex subunit 2, mitochondrial isoform X1 n=1 Tax=Manduca sexta TaxID=7130 RepID=UPI00188EE7E5|nr:cytochrome b-c1 complex subunit 2, mitochondrial isoform X1 [Manduca sexta]